MELLQKLNWRYATKRMNGNQVSQEKVDAILNATRLSASSYGLQPYKVIVIENKELREKLKPAAYNQAQITEASHLLVFAVYENITADHINEFMALHANVKGIEVSMMAPFKNMLEQSLLSRPAEANFNWAARQAYIALGTAMIAAASEHVDATPMEGFNPAQFDEILGLKEKGLRSVVLLPIGYRDENNDALAKTVKVRKETKDFVININ